MIIKQEGINGTGQVIIGSRVIEINTSVYDLSDGKKCEFGVNISSVYLRDVMWFDTFDEAVDHAINNVATTMDMMEDICNG